MRLENRLALVPVEEELAATVVLRRLAVTEYPRTLIRKDSLRDQIVDSPTRLECRIQLQQRLRPEALRTKVAVDELLYPRVSDLDEAPRVIPVVVDKPIPEFEHVHFAPPRAGR